MWIRSPHRASKSVFFSQNSEKNKDRTAYTLIFQIFNGKHLFISIGRFSTNFNNSVHSLLHSFRFLCLSFRHFIASSVWLKCSKCKDKHRVYSMNVSMKILVEWIFFLDHIQLLSNVAAHMCININKPGKCAPFQSSAATALLNIDKHAYTKSSGVVI